MSSILIQCRQCGAIATAADGPCSQCGGNVDVTVQLTGGRMEITGGSVATTAHEKNRVRYGAVGGAKSDSQAISPTDVRIDARGPIDVGRRGEDRVLNLVRSTLAARGHGVVDLKATDANGEDGRFEIDGENVVIQIVTVPHETVFWREVGRGSGSAEGEASEMIDSAIRAKSDVNGKGSMVVSQFGGRANVLSRNSFTGSATVSGLMPKRLQ